MRELLNPTEEHAALREMMRQFAEREVAPQAEQFDREERFNLALFRKLGELGVLGVTVPERFGGAGMDAVAAAIVHEELAAYDPGFCLAYLAHSMLFVNNLAVNGDDAQRERYLPGACSGELVGAMCMSEPGAGTDVLAMGTIAKKTDDGWSLTGQKLWITNGAIDDNELGDAFLVYAKHEDRSGRSLSLFLVPKGTPGLSLGQKITGKLGMRASMTAEIVFEECRVPADALVGAPGSAIKSMMRNLAIERVALAAMSLGIARRSIEIMNRYAQERVSFGQPLNRHGQIQSYIADSYAEYMAGRAYVYAVAGALGLDEFGGRADSDGVKLFCAPMGKRVADRAIQVLGGFGYVAEYDVERLWRDAKLLEIGGGTLEAHQKNITRDLAAMSKLL